MTDFEASARSGLRRTALLYLLLTSLAALICYYIFTNRASGFAFVTLSIVGVVGLLLAYQVLQHLRDLSAPVAASAGIVQRKWQRADLIIVWQSYYLTINRTVFHVKPEDYVMVDEGMHVRVVHFPNTLTVVSVREAPRVPPDAPES